MKAIYQLLFLVFLWPCLSGCGGPPEEMILRWQLPVSAKSNFYPIAHGEHLILPSRCGAYDCLKQLDPVTGKLNWTWVDSMRLLEGIYYNQTPFISDNILVLPNGKTLVGINTDHGTTAWVLKDARPGASHLGGLGTICTRSYTSPNRQNSVAKAFDCQTGRLIHTFDLNSTDSALLQLRSPDLYVALSGDTLCFAGVAEYVPRGSTDSFLKIWTFGQSQEAEEIPILQDNLRGECISKQGIIGDDHLTYWMAGRTVFCISPERMEVIWHKGLPRDMLSSQPYLLDSLLILACEDEVLYALNTSNGKIAWTCPIAGTPSRVFLNSGTLYLVGGSSQKLYCVDAATGELLREYESGPDKFGRLLWAGLHTIVVQEGAFWRGIALPRAPLLPAAMPNY